MRYGVCAHHACFSSCHHVALDSLTPTQLSCNSEAGEERGSQHYQWSEGSPEPTYAGCQYKLIPLARMIKNLPAMQETQVQSLGQEETLEKGMATHSSILA